MDLDLTGEQRFHPVSDARNTVELHGNPGDNGYWEEIKGNGCKHYRNVVTNGYLGRSSLVVTLPP